MGDWSNATAPPCPKCGAENCGRKVYIRRNEREEWGCDQCGKVWKESRTTADR